MKKQLLTIVLALFAVTGFAQQDGKIKISSWQNEGFFQYDYNLPTDTWDGFSRHYAFGDRFYYGNVYNVGFGLSADFYRFRQKEGVQTVVGEKHKIAARSMQIRGELFQRLSFKSIGLDWDLGGYGAVALTRRVRDYVTVAQSNFPYDDEVVLHYYGCENMNRFQYGVTTRIRKTIGEDFGLTLYAYYRLSDILTDPDPVMGSSDNQPSPWSIGIEFAF